MAVFRFVIAWLLAALAGLALLALAVTWLGKEFVQAGADIPPGQSDATCLTVNLPQQLEVTVKVTEGPPVTVFAYRPASDGAIPDAARAEAAAIPGTYRAQVSAAAFRFDAASGTDYCVGMINGGDAPAHVERVERGYLRLLERLGLRHGDRP